MPGGRLPMVVESSAVHGGIIVEINPTGPGAIITIRVRRADGTLLEERTTVSRLVSSGALDAVDVDSRSTEPRPSVSMAPGDGG